MPERNMPDQDARPSWDEQTAAADDTQPTALEDRDLDATPSSVWEKGLEDRHAPWEEEQQVAQPKRVTPPPLLRTQPQRRMPAMPTAKPSLGGLGQKAVQAMQQMVEQARQAQQQAQQRQQQQQQRQQRHAAPQRRQQAAKQAAAPQPDTQAPYVLEPAPQAAPQARPAQKDMVQRMFCNLDNVRMGIVMREVLGPPKALL
jgi:hypothetical protein